MQIGSRSLGEFRAGPSRGGGRMYASRRPLATPARSIGRRWRGQAGVASESSAVSSLRSFATAARSLSFRPARHLLWDGGRASKGMGPIPVQPDPLGPRLQRRHRWRRRTIKTDNRRDLCTRHGCPAGYSKPVVLLAAKRLSGPQFIAVTELVLLLCVPFMISNVTSSPRRASASIGAALFWSLSKCPTSAPLRQREVFK